MRPHGAVASAAGLLPFGHLGLGFQNRAEFVDRAAEYIADGLQHNQYVAYVGDLSCAELRRELAAMPGVAGHPESGGILVKSAKDYYPFCAGSDVLDAETAVAMYAQVAQEAIANGYSGFRAVVDVTPVARSCEQREALATAEYLNDQQIAVGPFSAMCAYDTSQLGPAAEELLCLHPFVGSTSVTFRLYAEPAAGVDFALAGEIDAYGNKLFATILQRAWPLGGGHTLCIGARGLEFIGHEQLLLLDRRARQERREIRLLTDQPVLMRLVTLLDLTNLRVEPPAALPAVDGEFGYGGGQLEERESSAKDQRAVGQVAAMVMQNLGVDAQEAFAVLAKFSHDTDANLCDLVERIHDELTGPEETRRSTLHALEAVRNRLWPVN